MTAKKNLNLFIRTSQQRRSTNCRVYGRRVRAFGTVSPGRPEAAAAAAAAVRGFFLVGGSAAAAVLLKLWAIIQEMFRNKGSAQLTLFRIFIFGSFENLTLGT